MVRTVPSVASMGSVRGSAKGGSTAAPGKGGRGLVNTLKGGQGGKKGASGASGPGLAGESWGPGVPRLVENGLDLTPVPLRGVAAAGRKKAVEAVRKDMPGGGLGGGSAHDVAPAEVAARDATDEELAEFIDEYDGTDSLMDSDSEGSDGGEKDSVLVTQTLTESATDFVLHIAGVCVATDFSGKAKIEERNAAYDRLVSEKAASDKYTGRHVQTLNFAQKHAEVTASPPATAECGCEASAWDIWDANEAAAAADREREEYIEGVPNAQAWKKTLQQKLAAEMKKTLSVALASPDFLLDVSESQPAAKKDAATKASQVVGLQQKGGAKKRRPAQPPSLPAFAVDSLIASPTDRVLFKQKSLQVMRSRALANSLATMERCVQQNRFHAKQLRYRNHLSHAEVTDRATKLRTDATAEPANGDAADPNAAATPSKNATPNANNNNNNNSNSTNNAAATAAATNNESDPAKATNAGEKQQQPAAAAANNASRAAAAENGGSAPGGDAFVSGGPESPGAASNSPGNESSRGSGGGGTDDDGDEHHNNNNNHHHLADSIGGGGAVLANDEDAGEDEASAQEPEDPWGWGASLELLWAWSAPMTRNRTVTAMSWNRVNRDILAVGYGSLSYDAPKSGLVLFWSLRNPTFPERVFRLDSGCTAVDFSTKTPHLLAVGMHDGTVAIYNVRREAADAPETHHGMTAAGAEAAVAAAAATNPNEDVAVPVLDSENSAGKHMDPVWQVQWVDKGSERGESLVSISTDGRVIEWSMKKGLEDSCLMILKRVGASEGVISRQASGLCFDFARDDPAIYLAGTEDGLVHRCSSSYNEQYLETYVGHTGPVYRIRASPFWAPCFLSCSADWTVKLWHMRDSKPAHTFQSVDLADVVHDVAWSPHTSTVFASVAGDGRMEIWDLAVSTLDPVIRQFSRPQEDPGAAAASGDFFASSTDYRLGASSKDQKRAQRYHHHHHRKDDGGAAAAADDDTGTKKGHHLDDDDDDDDDEAHGLLSSPGGGDLKGTKKRPLSTTSRLRHHFDPLFDGPPSPPQPNVALTAVLFAATDAPVLVVGDSSGAVTCYCIKGMDESDGIDPVNDLRVAMYPDANLEAKPANNKDNINPASNNNPQNGGA